MIKILDYKIVKKIHQGSSATVFRCIRVKDTQPVILKILNREYPTPGEITRFKHNYEVAASLDVKGVCRMYDLAEYQNCPVIIHEDIGGKSLDGLISLKKFQVDEFLKLAITITDILSRIHKEQVIHKNINPGNIIWNQDSKEVRIIDFGVSSSLFSEPSSFLNFDLQAYNLTYMSPEQTGRINQYPDYRTDFYSLGATFYEMLSGIPVFQSNDPAKIIHFHIARYPELLHKIDPSIPEPLSEIIHKLLAKNVENRYKNALGIKYDLKTCLEQLVITKGIEPFPIGQNDFSDRLFIPQKLYGRKEQIDTLVSAFERSAAGAAEVVMVAGLPGIGKTCLINEIQKQGILKKKGFFCSGKFDQYKRDIPHYAMVQAFRELIKQILTQSEQRLLQWKIKLLKALEPNGQIIVEVIPELGLIIGQQPGMAELPSLETRNRFNIYFKKFIKVFEEQECPLTIFLDDLQWADPNDLKMIELFLNERDNRYLLLIGAFRVNEVSKTHGLLQTLDIIRKKGVPVKRLELGPLKFNHVSAFVEDTFNCEKTVAEPLAELFLNRTFGNPFFIKELTHTLYSEKLIEFNYHQKNWHWDLVKIREKEISERVVDLMIDNIRKLPGDAQDDLKTASCIGSRFDLKLLSLVLEKSLSSVKIDLLTALGSGIIAFLGENSQILNDSLKGNNGSNEGETRWDSDDCTCIFLHDHIQQAAYSLLSEKEKRQIHLKTGRILLSRTEGNDTIKQRIYDVVNPYNMGVDLISDDAELNKLICLNLVAGKKAKSSIAYETALIYFKKGMELLRSNGWEDQYDLTLEFHVEAAETAYLTTDFVYTEKLVALVLQRAKTILDKVKAYEVRIEALKAQNNPQEAIQTGLKILKQLAVRFPAHPAKWHVLMGYLKVRQVLMGKSIDQLIHLPLMTDKINLAIIRLLSRMGPVAYMAFPDLLPLLIFKLVTLSVRYGNSPWSAFGYVGYGLILCSVIGNINAGYQFGKLAIMLATKPDTKELNARTFFLFNITMRQLKEPFKNSLQAMNDIYQLSLETGDLEFVAWCLYHQFTIPYHSGMCLDKIIRFLPNRINSIEQSGQKSILDIAFLTHFLIHRLIYPVGSGLGPGAGENHFGEIKTLESIFLDLKHTGNSGGLYTYHFHEAILSYLFCEPTNANYHISEAKKYLSGQLGLFVYSYFFFLDSLIALSLFPKSRKTQLRKLKRRVIANQTKLSKWARYAPDNFEQKYILVQAELAKVSALTDKAGKFYDQAITLAKKHEYLNDQALCYELAARFHLSLGQTYLGNYYLKDAHYTYQQWGAKAKVKDMEYSYPQLVAKH